MIIESDVDFCLLQETWKPQVSYDIMKYHTPIFSFRNVGNGGGTGIYISQRWSMVRRLNSPNIDKLIETTFVEVKNETTSIMVGSVYIGFLDKARALSILDTFLESLAPNCKIIIGGDFNINFLDSNCNNTSRLKTLCTDYNLNPLCTSPTRLNMISHNATLLDNILTNIPCNKTSVLTYSISDHFQVCGDLDLHTGKPPSDTTLTTRDYSKPALDALVTAVKGTNWDAVVGPCRNDHELERGAAKLTETLGNLIDSTCKVKRIKLLNNNPWFSKGLKISRRSLSKLYKAYMNRPNHFTKDKLVKYRSLYKLVIKKAKELYFKKELDLCKGKIKETWRILDRITCRKGFQTIPEKFVIEGRISGDANEISNYFNKRFNEFGLKIHSNKTVNQEYIRSLRENRLSDWNLEFKPVSHNDIENLVWKMRSKRSCGIDPLSNKVLKLTIPFFSKPFCRVINSSMKLGYFPSCWKVSKVAALHKSGDKCDVGNYRPISMLSVLSKVVERVTYNQVSSFLNMHNLHYKHQYGFREGNQTSHLLHAFEKEISRLDIAGEKSQVILVDFAKAFDSVHFEIMREKASLYWYGQRCS